MKQVFLSIMMVISISISFSCNDNSTSQPGTHTHEDGSVHTDHDTTKPQQEEFKVPDSTYKDSAGKEHTHADGKKHTH